MKHLLILSALLLVSACHKNGEPVSSGAPLGQPIMVSSEKSNAAEPAIAVSREGSVNLVWVDHHEDGQSDLMFARFNSEGVKQGETVQINPKSGVATAWRGDPPMIAVAPDKTILVSWTEKVKTESGHATDLYLSASRDEGRTFSGPVKVNDDQKPAVHGMHSLAVDSDGRIYVAWLDERNTLPVPTQDTKMKKGTGGHHMESNREVFIASSTDNGRTFATNKRVAANACPCCKTALTIGQDRRVYLSWRQVLPGNFRHIAVTSSADHGESFAEPKIVSDDQWMLAGCPVSGPAMSVSADGVLRVLWYSAGKNGETGVYFSESKDGGNSFGPRQLVVSGEARGTPVLMPSGTGAEAVVETAGGKIVQAALSKSSKAITDGGLPAAGVSAGNLVTSYVAKVGESQRVYLVFTDAARQ